MPEKDTVAVIDVGSNSIKLLVACKASGNGRIESVHTKTYETRISTGISQREPVLTQEAMDAGCQSIAALVSVARNYAPRTIKIVATSAVRDASNGPEFTNRVNAQTGVPIDILTGIEEATYIGKGLRCDPQIDAMEQFFQMDIGGGSLELSHFNKGALQQVCSLKLGAVRLTERFVKDRAAPISSETETQVEEYVRQSIEDSGFVFGPNTLPFVVTGGTFKVAYDLLKSSKAATTASSAPTLQKADIAKLKSRLARLSLQDRQQTPKVPKSRADILPVALITIDTVLGYAGCQTVLLSPYNLRYGIAAELLLNGV